MRHHIRLRQQMDGLVRLLAFLLVPMEGLVMIGQMILQPIIRLAQV